MIEAWCVKCKKKWAIKNKSQAAVCPECRGKLEYTEVGKASDEEGTSLLPDDVERLRALGRKVAEVRREIGKCIVGQDEIIIQLLAALFADGHCLLEGVPGLAKTMIVRSLADTLGLDFKRIQFTPDLMPSDITGTEVYEPDKATGKMYTRFVKGPIFANLILADEINRTPPKTQAALLEAMAERQVTVGDKTMYLDGERDKNGRRQEKLPFLVMATQNPIEQEGTYPLPEAQQDRFLFKLKLHYPTGAEEYDIMRFASSGAQADLTPVLSAAEITEYQELVHRMPVAKNVFLFALHLVRATRRDEREAVEEAKQWIRYGAGPRASINLILAAKSLAAISGRDFVTRDDVCKVAKPVLRHRIIPSFQAMNDELDNDHIIDQLLDRIKKARSAQAVGA